MEVGTNPTYSPRDSEFGLTASLGGSHLTLCSCFQLSLFPLSCEQRADRTRWPHLDQKLEKELLEVVPLIYPLTGHCTVSPRLSRPDSYQGTAYASGTCIFSLGPWQRHPQLYQASWWYRWCCWHLMILSFECLLFLLECLVFLHQERLISFKEKKKKKTTAMKTPELLLWKNHRNEMSQPISRVRLGRDRGVFFLLYSRMMNYGKPFKSLVFLKGCCHEWGKRNSALIFAHPGLFPWFRVVLCLSEAEPGCMEMHRHVVGRRARPGSSHLTFQLLNSGVFQFYFFMWMLTV